MRATFVLVALLAAAAAAPAAGGGTSLARPAWLAPVELTPRADYSIFDQNVAIDGHDDALAVWSKDEQGVFASYRPAGGSWQAATKFDACGIEPQAAFDGAGNATVVWLECAPAYTRIAVAERRVDGSWTSPVVLSTPGRSVGYAHLAVAGSGAAVISWIENDGKDAVVEASVREPGSTAWEPAAQVSSTGASAEDSSPAVDEKGDVVVGFTREDPAGAIAWAAFRPVGGAWQRAVNLSPPGETAFDVHVAMRADGSAVALWTQSGAGRLAVRSAATGAWAEQPPPLSSYAVETLVADSAGDVAAAWQSDEVMVSELPAGSNTWQAPLAIPSTAPGLQTFTLGFDSGRGLVAVWGTGADYNSGSLAASRLPAGATAWTQPIVSPVVQGLLWTGHTAVDPDGDAVAVYETPNGASVATIILDSAAPRAVSATVPRTGRADRRLTFVAAAADMSGVTLRWRFGDGKTATGASVKHAYRKTGRYVVTVVATDAAGHAVTVSRSSLRVS
jgi:PKD domain